MTTTISLADITPTDDRAARRYIAPDGREFDMRGHTAFSAANVLKVWGHIGGAVELYNEPGVAVELVDSFGDRHSVVVTAQMIARARADGPEPAAVRAACWAVSERARGVTHGRRHGLIGDMRFVEATEGGRRWVACDDFGLAWRLE